MTRMPSSPLEFGLLFIFMVGAATTIAFAASATITLVQVVLNPATQRAIVVRAPWFVGGVLVGSSVMVYAAGGGYD